MPRTLPSTPITIPSRNLFEDPIEASHGHDLHEPDPIPNPGPESRVEGLRSPMNPLNYDSDQLDTGRPRSQRRDDHPNASGSDPDQRRNWRRDEPHPGDKGQNPSPKPHGVTTGEERTHP